VSRARVRPARRLVLAGELMLDVLLAAGRRGEAPGGNGDLAAEGLCVRPGGSVANLALAAAGLERETGTLGLTVVGKLGRDPNGKWIARRLGEAGIELPVAPASARPTGYLVVHRRRDLDRPARAGRRR